MGELKKKSTYEGISTYKGGYLTFDLLLTRCEALLKCFVGAVMFNKEVLLTGCK